MAFPDGFWGIFGTFNLSTPKSKILARPPPGATFGKFPILETVVNRLKMRNLRQIPNTAFWDQPTFFLRKVAGIGYFFELKCNFGRKVILDHFLVLGVNPPLRPFWGLFWPKNGCFWAKKGCFWPKNAVFGPKIKIKPASNCLWSRI